MSRHYGFFQTLFSLIAFITLFATSACCDSSALAEDRADWVVWANERNCDAVVCIHGDKVDESSSSSRESSKTFNGMGTGIIIDSRGYIVTNLHVVEGIRSIQVTTRNRTQYTASLVANDPERDIALIKIKSNAPLQTIRLGRSDDLLLGERCMAIGNPYGYEFTITEGRISGLNRKVIVNANLAYLDSIQISTLINPGNSGGPLFNVSGEMIGLNAAIRQEAVGIAFAIPVDQVTEVAAKLIGEIAERSAYLGVIVADAQLPRDDFSSINKSNYRDKDVFAGRQVVVETVESNSPAALVGLKKGDFIQQVGDVKVRHKLDFYLALLDIRSRDDVVFVVERSNETIDLAMVADSPREVYSTARNIRSRKTSPPIKAEITSKTAQQGKPTIAAPTTAPTTSTNTLDDLVWQTLGIRYVPMPKEEYRRTFSQYLSEHPYGGVIVKDVREGSHMADKGIMPNDVIVGIHEWVTASQNDIRYIAKNWPTIKVADDKVRIWLFRDGQSYFTEIPTL